MIQVHKDTVGNYDPEDYEVVAEYDPESEQWTRDEAGLEQFYPNGTSPEAVMEQLNGPSYIAVNTEEESQIERSDHDGETAMDVMTDRANDTDDPPWEKSREKRVGGPMSSNLGVGDKVSLVDWGSEPSDEEEEDET